MPDRLPVVMSHTGARFRSPPHRPPERPPAISRDDDRAYGRRPTATWIRLGDPCLYDAVKGRVTRLVRSQYAIVARPNFRAIEHVTAEGTPKPTAQRIIEVPRENGIPAGASEERGSLAVIRAVPGLPGILLQRRLLRASLPFNKSA